MELDFLQKVLNFIKDFGGLDQMAKIAGIVLLVVESMKVSFFQETWKKLGNYKFLVAPVLSLSAGLVLMKPISVAGVLTYLLAGAGASKFHDLLDAVKGLPGVSATFQKVIDVVLGLLGPKKP
jgi:hypothetical protein